jgi:hypothetical protein
MSASHVPAARATAIHIAAALARYERHVRRLAATWLDMDLYRTVSKEIDEIRRACRLLPGLALPCTELLVSHAELIHALWREGQSACNESCEDSTNMLQEHLACIDLLARRCLDLASGTAGGLDD